MNEDRLIGSFVINNNSYFEYPDGTKIYLNEIIIDAYKSKLKDYCNNCSYMMNDCDINGKCKKFSPLYK
jgi:hypothetical protein